MARPESSTLPDIGVPWPGPPTPARPAHSGRYERVLISPDGPKGWLEAADRQQGLRGNSDRSRTSHLADDRGLGARFHAETTRISPVPDWTRSGCGCDCRSGPTLDRPIGYDELGRASCADAR